jgi:hypothetical protein
MTTAAAGVGSAVEQERNFAERGLGCQRRDCILKSREEMMDDRSPPGAHAHRHAKQVNTHQPPNFRACSVCRDAHAACDPYDLFFIFLIFKLVIIF